MQNSSKQNNLAIISPAIVYNRISYSFEHPYFTYTKCLSLSDCKQLVFFCTQVLIPCNVQEMCDGNQNASIVCGTLSLDSSGKEIMARLSNEIYNACRAGKLNLSGFPAFDPLVQALKSNGAQEAPKAFRVSSQVGDKLLVLESLAQKWVSNEGTAERAQQMIRDHNSEYNPEGEYWLTDQIFGSANLPYFASTLLFVSAKLHTTGSQFFCCSP